MTHDAGSKRKSEDRVKKIILSIVVAAAVVACSGKQDMQSLSAQNAPPKTQAGPATEPVALVENSAAPAPQAGRMIGTVLEVLDAGGYTYLRLGTQGGERWAAVVQTKVVKGEVAGVDVQMTMENFESKSLGRTFDRIAFGTMASGNAPQAPPAAMQAAAHTADTPAGHMAAPPVANINVERATGPDAKTIGELWSARASLGGKSVTVRGKVVKFLGGIMGKNFVHLRDGSKTGAEDADLTVTTDAAVAVGDVVVIQGKVSVDRDFGSGYVYPVIIEDAKVVR